MSRIDIDKTYASFNTKRAFVVTCVIEYVCLAKDEKEAKYFVNEAIEDFVDVADMTVGVDELSLSRVPSGWDDRSLVYHSGDDDISLKTVLDEYC